MSKLTESLSATEGAGPTLENAKAFDIQSLLDLGNFQQEDALLDAVKSLIGARRIYVTGARSAYSLAYYAGVPAARDGAQRRVFPVRRRGCLRTPGNGRKRGCPSRRFVSPLRPQFASIGPLCGGTKHARHRADRCPGIAAMPPTPTSFCMGQARRPFYSYVAPMAVLNALIWGLCPRQAGRDLESARPAPKDAAGPKSLHLNTKEQRWTKPSSSLPVRPTFPTASCTRC